MKVIDKQMHFPREQTNENRPPVARRAAVDKK